MLSSLILLSSLAIAGPRTEVGAGKDFGIGVEAGLYYSFTGKYFFGDNAGLAFSVGASPYGIGYTNGRVQFEGRVLEFADWDFADFGGYWNAGLASRIWLDSSITSSVQLGPTGGVGVELRFKEAPAAVYAETDFRLWLVGPKTGTYAGISQFGLAPLVGGRWYF